MYRLTYFFLALLASSLPVIFDSALKGTVLLAFVAIIVAGMRKASADARHLAWMLGIIGMLLLPICSAILPRWRVLPAWAEVNLPARVGERPFSSPALSRTLSHVEYATTMSLEDVRLSAVPLDYSFTTGPDAGSSSLLTHFSTGNGALWLSGIWFIFTALLLLRLIASILLLRRRSRGAAAVTGGPLQRTLEAACAQLCLTQSVRLFLDDSRIVPLVWGVFRPRIILPAEASGWEPARLRAVLLHELAHVKRRDVLLMLLTQIACALHWFNPLVWLGAWRLHVERERACDNLVLTSGVKPSDYAEHLLHVATQLETASPVGALAMARPSRLEGRLMAVLNQQIDRSGVRRSIAVLATVFSLGIIIPVAMLRAQDEPAISRDAGPTTNPDGEPASMLRQDSSRPDGVKKVPVLGDVPLLGQLFGGEVAQSKATEQTTAAPSPEVVKAHVLEVKADGSFALDATALTYEALAEKLTDSTKSDPNLAVTVRADKSAPYTTVAKVLEACRSAGVANVTISTTPDEDKRVAKVASEQPGKSRAVDPAQQEIARIRLERAARELERISELHHQKLVSAAELDRAKAEVEFRKAELAGDAAAAMRSRLQQAERELERVSELYKQKVTSETELERAQAEVQIRKAELAGDAAAVTRARLQEGQRELERLTQLNAQKLVSQNEVDRAKFEVDLRRAELAGDPVQVRRTRLQQAQHELERLIPLYEQKLVGRDEIERAKADVDLRMAEFIGDRALAARAGLKRAEAELDRASKLHAEKLTSDAEYEAVRHNVEVARAELQQATSETAPKTSARDTSSTDVVRLLDDAIKLANEKLAMLKREQGQQVATESTANSSAPETDEKGPMTGWQPFSPERLEQGLKAGKPVFIAFTADWSLDFKATEVQVLKSPAVTAAFTSRNVLVLKANWTEGDPQITEWLGKFGKKSVPLYVLYLPGQAEPHIFADVPTADEIVRQLSQREK